MVPRYSVLVLTLLIRVGHAAFPDGFDQSFCSPPPNDGGKAFPSLPKDYMARFEWNDHVDGKSIFVEDFVSVSNNIGTVFMTGIIAPGIVSKYITSADTDELFIIYDAAPIAFEDGNCVVKPLSGADKFALPIKKDPKIPGADRLLSGRSLLTLGANPVGSIMHSGVERKNGIICDKWVACLFIPEGQITLNVTYHFTNAAWYAAGGTGSAPVSIHASGASAKDKDLNIEQTFSYVYYSEIYPSKDPEFMARIFETPKHAYCPGRKNLYNLPNVPYHFGFRAELINSVDKTVLYTKEWYDFQSNYTRIDFKNPPTGNDTIDNSQSTETLINDFNTGVSYLIDKFSKKCLVKPIVGGEFDSLPVSGTKARLKSPKEFFDFDHVGKYPYQYMGEHMIRNVPCNGWISYRPYPFEDSKTNATYEWFFATADTIFKAQNLVENLEPMRMVIRSAELNVNLEYNIYRFNEGTPDPRSFDVRACFEDSGSTSFDMVLEGNGTQADLSTNVQLLRYWFQLSVEAFAGVRTIRVQDIEFTFTGKRLAVRFTLLGPAPIVGDVINNIDQAPLLEATNRLTESFTDDIFRVFFLASPTSPQIVYRPVNNTLRVIERKRTPGSYKPVVPTTTTLPADATRPGTSTSTPKPIVKSGKVIQKPGLSSGSAAGLAFGMLFVGILLAVGSILLYRRLKPVPYNTLTTS